MTVNLIKPTSTPEKEVLTNAQKALRIVVALVVVSFLIVIIGGFAKNHTLRSGNGDAIGQIAAIREAEDAYFDRSADRTSDFYVGTTATFVDVELLVGLRPAIDGENTCVAVSENGLDYTSYALSDSGTIWTATNSYWAAKPLTTIPLDGCEWLANGSTK